MKKCMLLFDTVAFDCWEALLTVIHVKTKQSDVLGGRAFGYVSAAVLGVVFFYCISIVSWGISLL